MFLKQRLTVSDYATYPFDFHKLFTLQKLWQWLLSCAKAFTYVVCLGNAAPVMAIILKMKKKKRNHIRLHWACHFQFSGAILQAGIFKVPKGGENKSSNELSHLSAIKLMRLIYLNSITGNNAPLSPFRWEKSGVF